MFVDKQKGTINDALQNDNGATGPHLDQMYKVQFSCTTVVGKRISHSIYALLLLLNIFGEFISGQLFSAQSGNDANVGWVVSFGRLTDADLVWHPNLVPLE